MHYSFKKILLAVFLAFVTVGVMIVGFVLIFPGSLPVLIVKIQFPESKFAPIYQVPQKREILSATANGGAELSLGKVKFTSPWTDETKKFEKESLTAIQYGTGDRIVYLFGDHAELFSNLRPSRNQEELEKLKPLYSEALNSKYLFYKAILETNPKKLHIFMPKNEAMAKTLLVVYKVVLNPTLEGGIYSFETERFKGFQLGDPNKSKGVELHFFDTNDTPYAIGLKGAKQNEIDLVITSLSDQ